MGKEQTPGGKTVHKKGEAAENTAPAGQPAARDAIKNIELRYALLREKAGGAGAVFACVSVACVLGVLALAGGLLYLYMGARANAAGPGHEAAAPPQIQTAADYEDDRLVLVIDPGHGGSDPGAMDASGKYCERELNREMALKVVERLEKQYGHIRVVLTVEEGEDKTVAERGKVANEENADLLLAMHLNGDNDKSVRGFQCFPAPPGHRYHAESRKFAECLVEEVKAESPVGIKGSNGIFYTYYHKEKNGTYTQNVVDSTWPGANDGSRDVTYGVIQNARCPAVLVEQWYITSAADMRLCNNEKGKNAMADAVYNAICRYFELDP